MPSWQGQLFLFLLCKKFTHFVKMVPRRVNKPVQEPLQQNLTIESHQILPASMELRKQILTKSTHCRISTKNCTAKDWNKWYKVCPKFVHSYFTHFNSLAIRPTQTPAKAQAKNIWNYIYTCRYGTIHLTKCSDFKKQNSTCPTTFVCVCVCVCRPQN